MHSALKAPLLTSKQGRPHLNVGMKNFNLVLGVSIIYSVVPACFKFYTLIQNFIFLHLSPYILRDIEKVTGECLSKLCARIWPTRPRLASSCFYFLLF